MKYKYIHTLRIISIILIIPFFIACEKNNSNDYTDPLDHKQKSMGKIEIDFQTPHGPMRLGCIKRQLLVLADNIGNLSDANYIYSFNVSDEQEIYSLDLAPGSYYFLAGLICICETNSCSANSFEGGQYGKKYTHDIFYITADETTKVVPAFH